MSRDFIENTEDTSHAEQLSKEHHTLILSDYAKNLEKSVKSIAVSFLLLLEQPTIT